MVLATERFRVLDANQCSRPGRMVCEHGLLGATLCCAEWLTEEKVQRAGFCRTPQKFEPLVEKCKRLNRAMRVGTNHGSLSARILSYYGDTPRGMVESAFEFADMCRDLDYHNFLFSMKASNPLVMVQVPPPTHLPSGPRHLWSQASLVLVITCRMLRVDLSKMAVDRQHAR